MTKSRYFIIGRSIILAVALAVMTGYLNDIGLRWFPHHEKYVQSVAAMLMIFPMVYFVFVPFFRAVEELEKERREKES